MPMQRPPPRTLAVLAALVAAAGARIRPRAGDLGRNGALRAVPGGALAIPHRYRSGPAGRYRADAAWSGSSCWLAVLCLLADAAIAVVHVGVEMGWWPSPLPECAAPHLSGGSIADRLASMPARPAKPCDEPTFLIPAIPVSLAAMNMLFALAFAAVLAMSMAGRSNKR